LAELANYHIIGRILYYVPYFAPIHPGRTLTTFGLLSGIVEALNGIGVAWTANLAVKRSMRDVGQALLKASLLLQIVVIALFIVLAVVFHRRCARTAAHGSRVQAPLLTLYISTALILTRCIFRTVEYFSISSSYSDLSKVSPILRYEWFFYVFEASLMLANSVLWNVRHPRRYLPEKYNTYLTQDGITELEGSGWKDNRPFLVTAVDPFGLFTKDDPKEKPFWETDGSARV
jgi:magnesium-transporting ATPase (P-type)